MTVQLLHGDCLQLMKEIPDKSVDMVLCDPPYGTTACKWDEVIPIDQMWAEIKRVTHEKSVVVVTANQPFSSRVVCSNLEWFKYEWVWVKNRPTGPHHSKNRPMGKHECVLVFSPAPMGHVSQLGDRRMPFNPQGMCASKKKTVTARGSHSRITGGRPNQVGREYESTTGAPVTLIEFAKDEDHIHPTQKPVALCEYLIRTYTKSDQTVLDFCMGSGSTGIACLNTGRRFIGIEKDDEIFVVAQNRIDRHMQDMQSVTRGESVSGIVMDTGDWFSE